MSDSIETFQPENKIFIWTSKTNISYLDMITDQW